MIGNDRNACVRVPVSEKCDLFECDVKIIAGMDNKIEREVGFVGLLLGRRSSALDTEATDTKICRAQYSSKPFPEQNAFSNENDRKGTLPQHGGVPTCTQN